MMHNEKVSLSSQTIKAVNGAQAEEKQTRNAHHNIRPKVGCVVSGSMDNMAGA